MSYRVYFELSAGLAHPIKAEPGTLARAIANVKKVEKILGFKITQYKDNPPRWERMTPAKGVSDKVWCDLAETHNNYVRQLYDQITEWEETPPENYETITIEDAQKFWYGLRLIHVPTASWTGDYYRDRMETVYNVMRGNETEGITFDADALTIEQASQVIALFAEYLDADDLRLEVPDGHDYLASSSDGGYCWCDCCGKPKTWEDTQDCEDKNCPFKDDDDGGWPT